MMKLKPDKGSLEWVHLSEPLKQLVRRGGPGGPGGGGGSGVRTFLGLLDTPNSYSGAAGKALFVNGAGTALEFLALGAITADAEILTASLPHTVADDWGKSVFLVVDPATGGGTVTLPDATAYVGRQIVVHVPDVGGAGVGTVTVVAPAGATLYNGSAIESAPATRVYRPYPASNDWYEIMAAGGAAAGATTYPHARAVCVDNMDLSGTETQDGVNLAAGDIALCINQTTAHQNGLWVVASGAWTRPDGWAPEPNDQIRIREGTALFDTLWQITNNTAPTLGTDAQTWRRIDGRIATMHGTDANAAPKDNLGRLRVSFPNLTANRIITMPRATGNDGQEVWVQIEANVAAGRTVTATPQGTELINGSAVITGPWAAGLWVARAGNWNRM